MENHTGNIVGVISAVLGIFGLIWSLFFYVAGATLILGLLGLFLAILNRRRKGTAVSSTIGLVTSAACVAFFFIMLIIVAVASS